MIEKIQDATADLVALLKRLKGYPGLRDVTVRHLESDLSADNFPSPGDFPDRAEVTLITDLVNAYVRFLTSKEPDNVER